MELVRRLFAGGSSFGPLVSNVPDLTMTFEESVLSVAPISLFIVLAVIYVHNLAGEEPHISAGILLPVKLVLGAVLFCVHLAVLVLWTQVPARPDMILPGSILTCVGSLCVVAILYFEHCRSIRPSSLLSIFLSVTFLFDLARTRSYFLRAGLPGVGGLSASSAALKLLLIGLEEFPKSDLINRKRFPALNSEAVSGFWNRSLFVWLNKTLAVGFQRIISIGDLQDLGPKLNSELLYNDFLGIWRKEDTTSKYALLKSLVRLFRSDIYLLVVPRLCNSAFILAQPLLLLQLASSVDQDKVPSVVIGGLCGATAIIYVGAAISRAIYRQLNLRVIAATRSVLMMALYHKTTKLSSGELRNSKVLTLMSSDLSGIEKSLERVHDAWASVIELLIGMAILAIYTGPACVLMLLPTGISAIVGSFNAKRMQKATQAWNTSTEARVAATSDALTQMSSIRISGFTEVITEQIRQLRDKEVEASLEERKARIWMHITAFFAEGSTPVLVLAAAMFWTRASDPLSVAEVFTVIAVTVVTTAPLATFLGFLPGVSSGYACLFRVQQYLLLEELNSVQGDEDESEKPRALQHYAVRLENATLIGQNNKSVLLDISLQLEHGQLIMLIGETGSGKSSLLKVILGEESLSQGSVEVAASDVGYCDQSSWLQNMSIYDNIIGQDAHNAILYKKVVAACALADDFEQFPEGDKFVVGANGCKLSGGQKQRVALARAVYCAAYGRAPLLMLDDVLSACDAHTSAIIMERVFGKDGLLRQPESKSTIIMVTSIGEHLSHADLIYKLSSSGKIKEVVGDAITAIEESELSKWCRSGDTVAAEAGKERQHQDAGSPASALASTTAEEDAKRQSGDVSLYKYYIRSIGWRRATPWFCAMAATTMAERMPLVFVRIWMSINPHNLWYFIGYGLLGAAAVVIPCLTIGIFYFKLVPRSSLVLHSRILGTVTRMRLWFFSSTNSGSLLNRFSTDVGILSHDLPRHFMQTTFLLFQIPTDSSIIVSGTKYAVAFLPFIFLAIYFIQFFYLRTSRQMRYLDLEARAPLLEHFSETAAGIQHVRAFRWRRQFVWHCLALLDYAQRPFYYFYCIQAWLNLVLDLTIAAIAVIVVAFSLSFTGSTSQAAVGLSMVNIITLSTRLSSFVRALTDLELSIGAISRVRQFINKTPVEKSPINSATRKELGEVWPTKGRISFRNVTARYNDQDFTSEPVLRGISTKIKAGSKVGIRGRTGSGKSSFLLAILDFLDYTGSIKIDGEEIRKIPHEFLRQRLISVSQEGIALSGSLRKNLDPYDNPELTDRLTNETLIDFLERTSLWNSIDSRGYDLDTPLEDLRLSAGQMQLLAVARAMLRREYNSSRIILLDEALSSVDRDTAKKVQAEMAACFANCTVVTIAHRLEALEDCDAVLEIQDGRITRSRTTKATDESAGAPSNQ